jgi:hypothetical protein
MIVELGAVYTTPGAEEALEEAGQSADEFVLRHANGDWGELGTAEVKDNQTALREGFQIFSAYTLSTSVRIWIVTEDDRSLTTVLLPNEFPFTAKSTGGEPMNGWSRTWRR